MMIGHEPIFVLSPPRSGSTLLQRLLGSHSKIFTHPEPHIIAPLAHLGFYNQVDRAPYDHINAAKAFREFVDELPQGEEDYLDALRAYANTLYQRVLPSPDLHFLDKTPENVRFWPFLLKLFPHARYIVLTRHPAAIMHSVATSFFGGDYEAARVGNQVLERFVPAIGTLMRTADPRLCLVKYEDLVQDPNTEVKRLMDHLGLIYEESQIEYGKHSHITKSYGDPFGVHQHQKPVTDSKERWVGTVQNDASARTALERSLGGLSDEDLQAYGYPRDELFEPLHRAGHSSSAVIPKGNLSYKLQRQVFMALKNSAKQRLVYKGLSQIRYVCDVVLRARDQEDEQSN